MPWTPYLITAHFAPGCRPCSSLQAQSYDATTRTFYAPVGNIAEFFVREKPTADDVDGARGLIDDALGEFPFADQAS